MDVVGDAVDRNRRSEAPALSAPAVGRRYDYRRFCTSAWKVGNFLRHLGVRGGAGVGVADDPLPEPVLAFYGAALLGGVVRFDPGAAPGDDLRALVVPAADLDGYEAAPGTKLVAYGDAPGDPTVSHFERDVWSENPTAPPDVVAPGDPLVRTADGVYTHGEVLGAARRVVERESLSAGDAVAVRGPFTDPGVVAAGLLAPVVAGGLVVLGGDGDEAALVVGGPEGDVDTAALFDG